MARRAKYSVQQKAFATAVQGNTTTTIEVVPSTVVEGMRKVKHITVNASIQGQQERQQQTLCTGLSCMFLRGLLPMQSTSQLQHLHRDVRA